MTPLKIYKAQDIDDIRQVKSAGIEISITVPELSTPKEQARLYRTEAFMLEKMLFDTLPGGTYDQLLVRMMEHKASLFRISHNQESEREND